MSTEESILVHDDKGVRTITLNRPDVLNAFNDDMLLALRKALRAAEKEKTVRCLILTGAGRAFGSGQDLADVKDRYTKDEPFQFAQHLRDHYNPIITKMRTMEKLIIGAVNGVAAGAGCSLALACDMRIAAESASFIQSFVKVGLVPDSGSTFMLPRLIGVARAMEMACTGRKIEADEALRIGLVNRVVPDADLLTAATELATKLASMPTRAIGLIKRAINSAWTSDLETQLDYEAMLQQTAGQTHDHREGVMAFIEKRKPVFRGE